eukprot:TRINITY_DN28024_c0_g1_i1.p1 TRINITY_DN28024_c0_g1~~TRINITY_DN28024_c0_g1_i1.p1  ORF type:complete len:397 (+),score=119.59 TRINITY_DN28024_c0_g1_i1:24-1193(+)
MAMALRHVLCRAAAPHHHAVRWCSSTSLPGTQPSSSVEPAVEQQQKPPSPALSVVGLGELLERGNYVEFHKQWLKSVQQGAIEPLFRPSIEAYQRLMYKHGKLRRNPRQKMHKLDAGMLLMFMGKVEKEEIYTADVMELISIIPYHSTYEEALKLYQKVLGAIGGAPQEHPEQEQQDEGSEQGGRDPSLAPLLAPPAPKKPSLSQALIIEEATEAMLRFFQLNAMHADDQAKFVNRLDEVLQLMRDAGCEPRAGHWTMIFATHKRCLSSPEDFDKAWRAMVESRVAPNKVMFTDYIVWCKYRARFSPGGKDRLNEIDRAVKKFKEGLSHNVDLSLAASLIMQMHCDNNDRSTEKESKRRSEEFRTLVCKHEHRKSVPNLAGLMQGSRMS